MTHKSTVWKSLTETQQDEWKQRAKDINLSKGIVSKEKQISYKQQLENWHVALEAWGRNTNIVERGEMPVKPVKPPPKPKASEQKHTIVDAEDTGNKENAIA